MKRGRKMFIYWIIVIVTTIGFISPETVGGTGIPACLPRQECLGHQPVSTVLNNAVLTTV